MVVLLASEPRYRESYRVWTLHGEDLSNAVVHPPLVANIGEKTSDDDGFEMGHTEEETIGDVGIGMRNFVDSAFGLHGDAVAGDDNLGIEFDEPYVPEPDLGKSMPLYGPSGRSGGYPHESYGYYHPHPQHSARPLANSTNIQRRSGEPSPYLERGKRSGFLERMAFK
ncbi:hypothetical protein IFM89_009548 [Coptis chinensis]|uniref:Uncharacterized protein n=1 Tax=Coptis chinensis TaxID=261450 RepID=A0A835LZT9_9MAGN|nr:hypothetical protein IFM89_009548 [Coptis chinensis]